MHISTFKQLIQTSNAILLKSLLNNSHNELKIQTIRLKNPKIQKKRLKRNRKIRDATSYETNKTIEISKKIDF